MTRRAKPSPARVPFQHPAVAAKFASYPARARRRLLAVRSLIFRTARRTPGVGEIEETLKWDEPAYLTRNRAGTTVRIDWKDRAPDKVALYVHCQTDLVETFRRLFPDDFEFEGQRALLLAVDEPLPRDALALCIEAALTYHLRRKPPRGRTPAP